MEFDVNIFLEMLGISAIRELRKAPFLHGLKREQATLLAMLFSPRYVPAKSLIVEEGDEAPEGPSLYFSNAGAFNMFQRDASGGTMLVRQINSNMFFGQSTFLLLQRHQFMSCHRRLIMFCHVHQLTFCYSFTFLFCVICLS